jgi:uncharacterized protein
MSKITQAFSRPQLDILLSRLAEPRRFIQVLAGPRQVGKTTLVLQALDRLDRPTVYASADGPSPRDPTWIEQQWDLARLEARESKEPAILVLDEVQKVPGWSETVKECWDTDTRHGTALHVVVLGSSPLLVQQGLTESLAGRFEVIRLPHWPWPEMHAAFGWDVETYICYGGYPGAAPLVDEPDRWATYIRDALIETTVSRDVLLMQRVDKPALLRQLFDLACSYTGQILSFNKMLGQLQDAGNTVTLAHYLRLLAGAGMVAGLQKFAGQVVRRRGSSPKLQVFNNALTTSREPVPLHEIRRDPQRWGRLVESAVGAHLLNTVQGTRTGLFYWRDRNREVDFVLQRGPQLVAIEVKSVGRKGTLRGIEAFDRAFSPTRKLLVGAGGLPLEEFLSRPAAHWLS